MEGYNGGYHMNTGLPDGTSHPYQVNQESYPSYVGEGGYIPSGEYLPSHNIYPNGRQNHALGNPYTNFNSNTYNYSTNCYSAPFPDQPFYRNVNDNIAYPPPYLPSTNAMDPSTHSASQNVFFPPSQNSIPVDVPVPEALPEAAPCIQEDNSPNKNADVQKTSEPILEANSEKKTQETPSVVSDTTVKPTVEDPKSPISAKDIILKEIATQKKHRKEFKRDLRPHVNIVFCGHVDAGKSTISGHLLAECGLVDSREMDKLRREASTLHREGWEYAYVMDLSEEERSKGKTHETGSAYLETDKRRITILDAPGHKAFVPSMIGGASQADIGVLVISARKGEFEAGFEKGGQTREHVLLIRTCGVKHVICVINKMDDVNWCIDRYDEILGKLRPFLRQNGYDEKKNSLTFIPSSGMTGENLIQPVALSKCSWYNGPSIMEYINNLVLPNGKGDDDVLCIPLIGAYKDDGKVYLYGKVESGSLASGERCLVLPSKTEVIIDAITIESIDIGTCFPGDNVYLRVRGIDDNDVHPGFVVTSMPTTLLAVDFFLARIVILDVKNIVCAGGKAMLHIHTAHREVTFHMLLAKIDKKSGKVVEKNPSYAKAGDVIMARMELDKPLVVETHEEFPRLGRFILRDEGKTIAIGLVTKLYKSTKESILRDEKN